MAMTNYERVGKALDLLRQGLAPFVEREFMHRYPENTQYIVEGYFSGDRMAQKPLAEWDVSLLLKLMFDSWNDVFRNVLGFAERSLVGELREWRNQWAHQGKFSSDDADRALDSVYRLLSAVSARESEEVSRMKQELRRLIYDEQVRQEKRKVGGSLIEAAASDTLKPWREVVLPHSDVASGRYQQAEFAADLSQVHLGEGPEEYLNAKEFFRRTFLTDSLKRLLIGGIRRLSGKGGEPVVQLQTNFGGGKTHSMLALYHLFSGKFAPGKLEGIEELMERAEEKTIPNVRRVVLVGNKISPSTPQIKTDGTKVHTLWGELAWQLGGAEAYSQVKIDDEKATSPGDMLRKLFVDYGPCLVLVDEWVAYARQLHDDNDLCGGTFETQFSFAQALTESAKLAGNCMLVISLPASDVPFSTHSMADDSEVGGIRGRDALNRLQHVVGRLESSWRPASMEEGFEIVRRRLFEPLPDASAFKKRDVTARAFADFYRSQSTEFPSECREAAYEDRLKAAYPIHPEVFDRLYSDWSTLVKFQRTRGVLRLMASVIHSLWEKGDKSPLILPSMIPLDDPRVQSELTHYLSDNWVPIIERDIDGPKSLPVKIDGENPNLGKLSATRRVARTIFLGSAPSSGTAHRGLEDRRIKLGCAMPGESPSLFGDGLRRLGSSATYLYQDGVRFWYATQPTVTKLADDRTEQLRRDPDQAARELEERLRVDLRRSGDFPKIHVLPRSESDVPDDTSTRLVVLPSDYPFERTEGNPAERAARGILESRGISPRIFRNTLVFLAADKLKLQDLDEAIRKFLAWKSILLEKEELDLTPNQVRQAEIQKQVSDSTVNARLPETYQWLLVPGQENPSAPVTWQVLKLNGGDGLAVKACRKLRNDEALLSSIGPAILRELIDKVPLWRGDSVSVKQLSEDFASYLYLPKLSGSHVIEKAIEDGVQFLTWRSDTFAYADRFQEDNHRYLGLRAGTAVSISTESGGLVVKPDIAEDQMTSDGRFATPTGVIPPLPPTTGGDAPPDDPIHPTPPKTEKKTTRFYGTVTVDPTRVGRDAGRVSDEVISHLAGQLGAKVKVTLEIEAEIPEGISDHVIRTVTENSRTLRFSSQGFEKE